MNLANRLTMLRFTLLPFFVLALAIEGLAARVTALVVFGFAAATDLYDGWIARSQKAKTAWGELMDPLADKLLVISGLIFFIGFDMGIPAWMVVLIVIRELGITGLRLMALLKGIVIPASGEGKTKTLAQMTTVTVILILCILKESGLQLEGLSTLPIRIAPLILVSITLLLGLASGTRYLWQYKEVIFPVEEKDHH